MLIHITQFMNTKKKKEETNNKSNIQSTDTYN